MSLLTAVILMLFALNTMGEGDYLMGSAFMLTSLYLFLLLMRRMIKMKKEYGTVGGIACLNCRAFKPFKEDDQ